VRSNDDGACIGDVTQHSHSCEQLQTSAADGNKQLEAQVNSWHSHNKGTSRLRWCVPVTT